MKYLWDKATKFTIPKKLSKKELEELSIKILEENMVKNDSIENYIINIQQHPAYLVPEFNEIKDKNVYYVEMRFQDKRTNVKEKKDDVSKTKANKA